MTVAVVSSPEMEGVFVVLVHGQIGVERNIYKAFVGKIAIIAVDSDGATNLQISPRGGKAVVFRYGLSDIPACQTLGNERCRCCGIRQCIGCFCIGKGDTGCIGIDNSGASPGLLGRS